MLTEGLQKEKELPKLPTLNAPKTTLKVLFFEYGRNMYFQIGIRLSESPALVSFGGEEWHQNRVLKFGRKPLEMTLR